ncbi:hypothetical protein KQI63_07695 [bacterium]|nr:hypothetical protein [bacterium]
MKCKVSILSLLALLSSTITLNGQVAYTETDVKQAFDFESWPGLDSPLKQPLGFLDLVETFIAPLDRIRIEQRTGSAYGEGGEISWYVDDSSEGAKYSLIASNEVISYPIEYAVQAYVIDTTGIGEVSVFSYGIDSTSYTICAAQNNHWIKVTSYVDSIVCAQIALAMIDRIVAASAVLDMENSPTQPVIGELSSSSSLFTTDPHHIIDVSIPITPYPTEIWKANSAIKKDDGEFKPYGCEVTETGISMSILSSRIVDATTVTIQVSVMNNRGEEAFRVYTLSNED